MTDVGSPPIPTSRHNPGTCTKHGFDSLIFSGSYGGHRRHMTDDGRRTTPGVWHKLPTGELKNQIILKCTNFPSRL